ncbi:sarcosine oxidase subunit gamma [Anianabacter salinae]|uniref:sarcosine oxidase subunit gamma n=1 Tax=Anianabacter salinae TaxID=2851023 RepID=UPI00225DF2BA|nr:sarcosine oxidase subunit gamma family protein [Anianabacter salinae]MBV0911879.1 sarcosine oxidase subunit gamma family protein [Anianabacter salinae]
MSDAVSVLLGARVDGPVTVEDAGLCGMIVLRGDLSSPAFKAACTEILGAGVPEALGSTVAGDRAVLWMSTDEVLVLAPFAEASALTASLAEALEGTHHLVADVSDARAVLRLTGGALRETLARLTPADVAPASFPPGMVRRTRLAQSAAAIRMVSDNEAEVYCFRSVARYVMDILANAAQGRPLGLF